MSSLTPEQLRSLITCAGRRHDAALCDFATREDPAGRMATIRRMEAATEAHTCWCGALHGRAWTWQLSTHLASSDLWEGQL